MKLYNKIFGNKGDLTDQDIEKYLSGKANAKEQHNIEAKALQNQLFADALDGYAKNKDFNINKLKNRTSKKLFKNNSTNYLVAIAAMFALVTILFFIPFENKTNELAKIPATKLPAKENIIKEETIKKSEKVTTTLQKSEEKEPVKPVKERIITKEKNKDLIAANTTSNNQEKIAKKAKLASKVEQPKILENNIEIDESKSLEPAYSAPITSGEVMAEISEEPVPIATKSKRAEKVFEDNFPIIYLADNTLKAANYNGKRLPKNEVILEDARSIGTSARYANETVAEAEMQVNNEYLFEEKYYYNDFLDKGLFKYKNEKYSEAIIIFDEILKQYPNDINALFYNGLSFYKLKKYDKAIKYFDLVINDKINIFDQEAEWNKALCLLETNKAEGEKLLQKIADDEGFYSQKAMNLLNE